MKTMRLPLRASCEASADEDGKIRKWGREATREKVITAVDVKNWLIVFTKRDQQKAYEFVQSFKQCGPQMDDQMTFHSKRLTDDADITITITLVKILVPHQCMHIYNVIL